MKCTVFRVDGGFQQRLRILLLCVTLTLVCISRGRSAEGIAGIISQRGYTGKDIGVVIRDLDNDSCVFSHNDAHTFIPASVLKLFTATAACDHFGPVYAFPTAVFTDSTFDADSGVVAGNLYIRGSGDPGFTAQRLWLFVTRMKHRGIHRVAGDVVVDDFHFDSTITGPGFSAGESSRAYQAPVGALSASFNCIGVHVRPGSRVGSPIHVDLLPPRAHTKIVCTAKTLSAKANTGISIKTKKYDNTTAVMVYGGMRITDRPRYIYRKAWHTWENFAYALQALLQQQDIVVDGSIRHGRTPDAVRQSDTLLAFHSEPLHEHIQSMCKYSNNFIAEMLYKSIGARYLEPPGTWEKGRKAVRHWWKKVALPGSLTVWNGSGMGTRNRVSPLQVCALLSYIEKTPAYYPVILNALPAAGVDGTLSRRFSNSPYSSMVRAKTGTLNDHGVHSLAGYILGPGRTFAFAVIINSRKKGQYYHWQTQRMIVEHVCALLKKE